MNKYFLKHNSGMAAIISVVIIGVTALLIVKSISLAGIDALTIGYNTGKAGEVLAITDGCAEETLRRWQLDPDYSATDINFNLGSGSCTVNTTGNESNITVSALGQVNNYYKRINVEAVKTSSTPISITFWDEVSE